MKWLLQKVGAAVGILIGALVGVSIVLYLLMPQAPQPPAAVRHVDELATYLVQVVEQPPELSVAVAKDYGNGFGMAQAQGDAAVAEDTVYHWWSMTKVITAVSILQLHEQGYLNLDHPISNYLPSFLTHIEL